MENGHGMTPLATRNFKFSFIGQNWTFLDPKTSGFEGVHFDRHKSIQDQIKDVENMSIKERITEHYRNKVLADVSDAATTASGTETEASEASSSTFTNQFIRATTNDSKPLSEEEALELATSLNLLRMFNGFGGDSSTGLPSNPVSDISAAIHVTEPMKVTESPRAVEKIDVIRLTETLLAAPPTASALGEKTVQQLHDETQRKSLKRLLKVEVGQGRQNKIGLSMAEKMKQRMNNATEQIHRVEISKNFKKYVLEKGLRMPHFLRTVDHTIIARDPEKHNADLKTLYSSSRPSKFRPSISSPRSVSISRKYSEKSAITVTAEVVASALAESAAISSSPRSLRDQVKTSQFATASSNNYKLQKEASLVSSSPTVVSSGSTGRSTSTSPSKLQRDSPSPLSPAFRSTADLQPHSEIAEESKVVPTHKPIPPNKVESREGAIQVSPRRATVRFGADTN